MEQTTSVNPLKQYFRQVKLYIKLPSGNSYYSNDVVEFVNTNEVGILPMTGSDELALKNPDALLNGEALIQVIKSCVPNIKNPRLLLSNDIDALITAIRYATFNDSLETNLHCPECNHENSFKLNLQYALDNMEFLESEYVVNLDSGVSVFVKPHAFPELLRSLHAQLEQSKLTRSMSDESISDNERSIIFGKAFKEMSQMTYELMLNSVIKVINESAGINVTDKSFIKEFLYNIDKQSIDKIDDLIKEINKIGIKKTFIAKCEKCDHQWENDIDFNPVNFS